MTFEEMNNMLHEEFKNIDKRDITLTLRYDSIRLKVKDYNTVMHIEHYKHIQPDEVDNTMLISELIRRMNVFINNEETKHKIKEKCSHERVTSASPFLTDNCTGFVCIDCGTKNIPRALVKEIVKWQHPNSEIKKGDSK